MTERVRVAVPDTASGERLRLALRGLDAELHGSPRELVVVAHLKSPNHKIVLDAMIGTVERWLESEDMGATRLQIGMQLPAFVRVPTAD